MTSLPENLVVALIGYRLIYSPDANNLNKFIAKLRAFTEGGSRKLRANATRVKAVSGECSTIWGSIRNRKSQLQNFSAEAMYS